MLRQSNAEHTTLDPCRSALQGVCKAYNTRVHVPFNGSTDQKEVSAGDSQFLRIYHMLSTAAVQMVIIMVMF